MPTNLTEINPGDMNKRVRIYAPPTSADTVNQSDASNPDMTGWTLAATRWAYVAPASGTAFVASEQVRNQTSHKIVMRYYPDLSPQYRLILGSRVFNVLSAIDEEERKIRHTVLAQEVL
ncbi:MAG TPA: phage head closure protein [Pirellulales bacterium]|nr:phage head closure protein [Pirellulales bacterium]